MFGRNASFSQLLHENEHGKEYEQTQIVTNNIQKNEVFWDVTLSIMPTSRCGVAFCKTWIFTNTDMITLNLA